MIRYKYVKTPYGTIHWYNATIYPCNGHRKNGTEVKESNTSQNITQIIL